ncbi:hypothetical protein DR88_5222 [Klebsiella pneumoniae]|nr:hypothetical protein DR88_5222 [Klebsiella pneumoniae]
MAVVERWRRWLPSAFSAVGKVCFERVWRCRQPLKGVPFGWRTRESPAGGGRQSGSQWS